jgi:hypothetical protein
VNNTAMNIKCINKSLRPCSLFFGYITRSGFFFE